MDNSYPCCGYCNYMKNSREYSFFLEQVKKIVLYTRSPKKYEKYLSDNQCGFLYRKSDAQDIKNVLKSLNVN